MPKTTEGPSRSGGPSAGHLPSLCPSEPDLAPNGVPLSVAAELRRHVASLPLPVPGAGRTLARMQGLARVAGEDLSVGRLYEGHTDALAILAEAGHTPRAGAAYGVWASRSPRRPVTAVASATGWKLSGTKEFCSGAGILDRALVTAEAPDGYRLFDLDLRAPGIAAVEGSWPAVGMAGSASLTVTFDSTGCATEAAVGAPEFYTGRPGFWFGAAGVAACWCGGAAALVDRLVEGLPATPPDHAAAETGRAVARVDAMRASLERVAHAIDADPHDRSGRARFRALAVRQTVHAACTDVLTLVGAAGGARPLGQDGVQARRAADLFVYLSQHHGAADAAELGRLACDGAPPWT